MVDIAHIELLQTVAATIIFSIENEKQLGLNQVIEEI